MIIGLTGASQTELEQVNSASVKLLSWVGWDQLAGHKRRQQRKQGKTELDGYEPDWSGRRTGTRPKQVNGPTVTSVPVTRKCNWQ